MIDRTVDLAMERLADLTVEYSIIAMKLNRADDRAEMSVLIDQAAIVAPKLLAARRAYRDALASAELPL